MRTHILYRVITTICIVQLLFSCTKILPVREINIKLIIDRPIETASDHQMPEYIKMIADLIPIEDTIYQPNFLIHRTDLDEKPITIEIERGLLNEFRFQMGLYDSRNLIEDYKNIDLLKANDYLVKLGKQKNSPISVKDRQLSYKLHSECLDRVENYNKIEELLERIGKIIVERRCLQKQDTIIINIISKPVVDPTNITSNSYCYEFEQRMIYFNSSPTITIIDKIHELKELLKKTENTSCYKIYLEISKFYNHIGTLNSELSFRSDSFNKSLDYLDSAKVISIRNHEFGSLKNDIDIMRKAGFFKSESWSNSEMRIRFESSLY